LLQNGILNFAFIGKANRQESRWKVIIYAGEKSTFLKGVLKGLKKNI